MSIQNELRTRGKVPFEGVYLEYVGEWTSLQPGDSYVAERNSGPKLLTVHTVKESFGDQNQYAGAVFPVENAYPYDLNECVKVTIIL